MDSANPAMTRKRFHRCSRRSVLRRTNRAVGPWKWLQVTGVCRLSAMAMPSLQEADEFHTDPLPLMISAQSGAPSVRCGRG